MSLIGKALGGGLTTLKDLAGKGVTRAVGGIAAAGGVLGALWYGNKTLYGENGSASKAEARLQGAEASEASFERMVGIKEWWAGLLEVLKDFFPSLGKLVDPIIGRLRDNIKRPEQSEGIFERASEVVSPTFATTAVAAPLVAGLGTAYALRGKKDPGNPVDPDTKGSKTPGEKPGLRSAYGKDDALKILQEGQVDPEARNPVNPAATTKAEKGFLSKIFKSAGFRSSIIGAIAMPVVYFAGTKLAGATTQDAAEKTFEEAVPYGDTVTALAQGDTETAKRTGFITTASWAGAAAGGTLGAAFFGVGAVPGALIGGAIGSIGAAIGGEALYNWWKSSPEPTSDSAKNLSRSFRDADTRTVTHNPYLDPAPTLGLNH